VTGWSEMLARAAREFCVPPAAFWRLSLPEWRALAGPPASPALPRPALEALMARFPDDDEEAAP